MRSENASRTLLVPRQGIGKNFYLLIINSENFLCSLIAYY